MCLLARRRSRRHSSRIRYRGRKVTEAMKRLPMEVLDEPAWKRFDSDNRLFWNMNTPDRL